MTFAETRQRLDREPFDRRSMVVFVSGTVLLIVFWYWGRPGGYFRGPWFEAVSSWYVGSGFAGQAPFHWWGVASLLIRVLAPLAIILIWLKEKPRDWGFSVRGQGRHWLPYLVFFVAMIPVLLVASSTQAFQDTYPWYSQARLGGWQFWGYQLFYGLQFLGVEAFFRGYLLFGLAPRFGWNAIPIMVIPYVMIHFGKPEAEVFAAIVAGYLLGYMALRSRSFVWGAALHWAVAITMDVMAIGWEAGSVGAAFDALF